MRSHRDSSEDIPSTIQIVKKKPEPLSPRSYFFNKKSKQISPCNSRDSSPIRDPSPSSRSVERNSPRQLSTLEKTPKERNKSAGMVRSSTPPPNMKLSSFSSSEKSSSYPKFIPSQSAVQLTRRDSDTLESLGQQISSSSPATNQSNNTQSKKIIDYCKQLSRTESNSESNPRVKKIPKPNLHLNLPIEADSDEDNPPEISPPKSNKSLPLSARARSHRNLNKTDSPQSQSARSEEPLNSPGSPSVAALIEYSKTLVKLTSSDNISDITQDRLAYANHALRFAQTTLTSPISSTQKSDEYDDSLYSTLLKTQSLLAHQTPENLTNSQESSAVSSASMDSAKTDSVKFPNISEVKEFPSSRRQSKLNRMKSWSPSTMRQTQDDIIGEKIAFTPSFLAKNRPVSSSRYLTAPSTSKSPSREEYEQDDEDPNRGNGEVRVRPRKALVKRYSKDPTHDREEESVAAGYDFDIEDF